MTFVITPVPFTRWGLDIIRSFLPSSKGCKYHFIGIDYFSKWVEVEAVNSICEENVKQFIFHDIICRFGVLMQIIIDNGTLFKSSMLKDFYNENKIKLRFALVDHPQANG